MPPVVSPFGVLPCCESSGPSPALTWPASRPRSSTWSTQGRSRRCAAGSDDSSSICRDLWESHGKPRFQQQLLQGEILKDDEVQPPLTLQLALLPLSEGKELLEAAKREATECQNFGHLQSSSDSSFDIFVDAFLNRL